MVRGSESAWQYLVEAQTMAIILAIETTTEACSCALLVDGEVSESYELMPRRHAREVLPMIRRLLDEGGYSLTNIDAIACSRGPGSFTGLRINAGVVQGLAFAADLPVIPVSTLSALALQISDSTGSVQVFACMDARISEVYCGFFNCSGGVPRLLGEEVLVAPSAIRMPAGSFNGQFCAGGNGLVFANEFPEAVSSQLTITCPDILPRASAVARLAEVEFARNNFMSPEAMVPVYLRDKVAFKTSER